MKLHNVRHSWPEKAGFELNRPQGAPEYILVHFLTKAEFMFLDEWHHCSPGDLFVMTPNMPHRMICHQPLVHDWIHITGDVEGWLTQFGLKANVVYHVAESEQITSRIARIEAEFFARDSYWETCTQLLLEELWIAIARQVEGNAQQLIVQEMAGQLRSLREKMILHPELPWTGAMMARQLNISVSRLYPLYRRQFAISPGHDLILMRVEKAKYLLSHGYSVAQTAEQLNYGSAFHFIRQFKQETGFTPGSWTNHLPKQTEEAI